MRVGIRYRDTATKTEVSLVARYIEAASSDSQNYRSILSSINLNKIRGNLVCVSFNAAWLLWKVWDIMCLEHITKTLTLRILKTFPQIKSVYLSQNYTSIASFSLDMSIYGWKLSCCFIFRKCYQVRYLHEIFSNSSQSILNHERLVRINFNILVQLYSFQLSVLNRSRI